MGIKISIIFLIISIIQARAQEVPKVDMEILFMPKTFTMDGKPMVYYELHLQNSSKLPIRLEQLDVFKLDNSELLLSISGRDLAKRFDNGEEDTLVLGAENTDVLYLEYGVPKSKKMEIGHRLAFSDGKGSSTASGATIHIARTSPLVLGPPLKGGPWAAISSPEWPRGHRRVFYTKEGKARIPARYAIDFMKLDKNGTTASEDINLVSNWYGFGEPVLAVADGKVLSVRTDFKDSGTLSEHPAYKSDEATGNYVSMDIGNGNIVFYEHVMGGSIRVKPGQEIKKGEIIASLGFTGQATSPHLHFHVASNNSPLGAEGVPFSFERFELLGKYNDFGKFRKEKWDAVKNSVDPIIQKERPGSNTVIIFK